MISSGACVGVSIDAKEAENDHQEGKFPVLARVWSEESRVGAICNQTACSSNEGKYSQKRERNHRSEESGAINGREVAENLYSTSGQTGKGGSPQGVAR